ncbi:MAG: replication initiator protein A [Planctomycetota bacterium]
MALREAPPQDNQLELFSAMFTDIATRDARETMEVPFLSLSKNPRFEPIRFESDNLSITVTGGEPYGIANIWDWDLVLWLLSQIRHSLDLGQPASRRVRFHRQQFLKDARRADGGASYARLEESIARLKNTTVVTTIRAKGKRTTMFSWIEYAEIERDKQGRIAHAIVVLPEWIFEAISNKNLVLSLHRDYFLLTGGLERWLYRLIRKGAGRNSGGWKWRLRTLHERSGSTRDYKYFARDVREIVARGDLLGYSLRIEEERGETVLHAVQAGEIQPSVVVDAPQPGESVAFLRLKSETYERAKSEAPGYDVYALEADWRAATQKNAVDLKSPDAAFLGWCRAVHQRRPLQAAGTGR